MTYTQLPASRDFTVFAGTTFRESLRWSAGGDPVDMTGWDAWMPYGLDLKTPLGELSVDAGTITLGADGMIELHMTDDETTAFAANPDFRKVAGVAPLVYNLILQNDAGEALPPFMRGNLYVQYLLPRPTP